MNFPKYRLMNGGSALTAEVILRVPEKKIFGGGSLVGDGVNQVQVFVYTSNEQGGPWRAVYHISSQYSGAFGLAPIVCDKYVKISPSGTGATFSAYECFD